MGLKLLLILSFLAIAQCKLVTLSCKQIRAFVDGHNTRRLLLAQGKIPGQPAASEMKKMYSLGRSNCVCMGIVLHQNESRTHSLCKWDHLRPDDVLDVTYLQLGHLHLKCVGPVVKDGCIDGYFNPLLDGYTLSVCAYVPVWDEELQYKASQWASLNLNYHNPDRSVESGRFTTGENLYWYSTTDSRYELEPDNAVRSWFSEHVNFTFGPLRASDFGNSKKGDIGHYTQVVWSNSNYLGCAMSQTFKNEWNKYFVVCNYGPGGNFLRVKPYRTLDGPSDKLICDVNECDHPYGSRCKII